MFFALYRRRVVAHRFADTGREREVLAKHERGVEKKIEKRGKKRTGKAQKRGIVRKGRRVSEPPG
jgi:hypothetical protein